MTTTALRQPTRKAPLGVTSLRGLTTFRQAFALALQMHPTTQQPVDFTYGRGGMWRAVNGQRPLRCDGNPELPNLDVVILWRDQPAFLGRHSRELVVADPIFVDDVGKDSAWRRYALRAEGPAADGTVEELLEELLGVAREVLCPRRGTLLLKVGDGNHGDRPQRNAYLVNRLVDRFGLYVCSQWTVPSRSMTDGKRQTVRHFPSSVHLFAIHPYPRCRHGGLRLAGRTRCAWCSKPIVVERIKTDNYCCAAHKQVAYRRRKEDRQTHESAHSPTDSSGRHEPDRPPTHRGGHLVNQQRLDSTPSKQVRRSGPPQPCDFCAQPTTPPDVVRGGSSGTRVLHPTCAESEALASIRDAGAARAAQRDQGRRDGLRVIA